MSTRQNLTSAPIDIDGSFEEVNAYFYMKGWTDGLPIAPPTGERIQAMIEGSGRKGSEALAQLPISMGTATIERIAINAVMAGCEPSYMPVVVAAVEAIAEKSFNLSSIQSTTNPATPMLVVNGPIRKALDINSATNALGPGRKANATIGRAIRLIMLNIGGGTPGDVDKSTQGWPGKYTFCFAENEEENPWEPLHAHKGFGRGESAVTAFGAHGTHNIHAGNPPTAGDLADFLAAAMINLGVNTFVLNGGEPALLLSPDHARLLASSGYTRQSLQEHIFQKARAPLRQFPKNLRDIIEQRGNAIGEMAPLIKEPRLLNIIVVGGAGGLFSTFVPVLGYAAVTKRISGPVAETRE